MQNLRTLGDLLRAAVVLGMLHSIGVRKTVWRAAWLLGACRTAALGVRECECPKCGTHYLYNQCRRRDCPLCSGTKRWAWVWFWMGRLLNGGHMHIVFTVPDDYRVLWQFNRELLAGVFFEAAKTTLLDLLEDDEYMGGTPGILAVFHSYGQSLIVHPHLHVLVSRCGLSPDGKRIAKAQLPQLLIYHVMRDYFAKTFVRLVRRHRRAGRLYLPKDSQWQDCDEMLSRTYAMSTHWQTATFERDNAFPVLKYLSHSVWGGCLADWRLKSITLREVVLHYSEWKYVGGKHRRRRDTMALKPRDFLRRWAEHVPEIGQKIVRAYGLYACSCRPKLDKARELLKQKPVGESSSSGSADGPGEQLDPLAQPCPKCRGPAVWHVHGGVSLAEVFFDSGQARSPPLRQAA